MNTCTYYNTIRTYSGHAMIKNPNRATIIEEYSLISLRVFYIKNTVNFMCLFRYLYLSKT